MVNVPLLTVIVVSVLAHEVAHGIAALHEGDDTAKCHGRISVNPLVHVSLTRTILLPCLTALLTHGTIVLAGAKPVPIDPRQFTRGWRSRLLVALSGCMANATLAFCAIVCYSFVQHDVIVWTVLFNVTMCVFNLLPIPTFDGWYVLRALHDGYQEGQS